MGIIKILLKIRKFSLQIMGLLTSISTLICALEPNRWTSEKHNNSSGADNYLSSLHLKDYSKNYNKKDNSHGLLGIDKKKGIHKSKRRTGGKRLIGNYSNFPKSNYEKHNHEPYNTPINKSRFNLQSLNSYQYIELKNNTHFNNFEIDSNIFLMDFISKNHLNPENFYNKIILT